MSSEEPIRQVPDELFRRVSAKPERAAPDALFGPPPAKKPTEPVEPAADAAEESVAAESAVDGGVESVSPTGQSALAGAGSVTPAAESDSPAAGSTSGVADASESAGDAPATPGRAGEPPGGAESVAAAAESESAAAGSTSTVAESVADSATSAAEAAESAPQAESAKSSGAPAEPVAPAAEPGNGAESVAAAAESAVSGIESVAPPVESDSGAAEPTPAVAEAVDSAAALSGDVEKTSGGPQSVAPEVDAESVAVAAVDAAAESNSAGELNASGRQVLLVIADSLSYFGPKGGLPADHPQIWPNLVGAELDWDVELVGRIGWTCRDAYWALIGDPRVWAAVPRAGAVVFAVGGMDTLPSPLPTALRELIRYVRPPTIRRGVRATYNWLQPKLSKLGRPVALPPKVSVDYLEQSREALAQLRPDLPVVAVLPSVHNCDAYGRVHSGRERAVKALRKWSDQTSVPLVDLGDAVRENIFSGEANPDGIHWGWDGHTAVANAMVKTLQEVR